MNQSEKVLLNSRLINQVKEANNFDFIRFFLAYSVMFNHFSTLTETDPFWFVSGGFRVKGFFIISGFLVMFSFLRTPNTRIFFRKRIQRIMPAYSLTILLCALIGLFLTSLSCREYLTSSSLYTYLICNLLTFNFLFCFLCTAVKHLFTVLTALFCCHIIISVKNSEACLMQ